MVVINIESSCSETRPRISSRKCKVAPFTWFHLVRFFPTAGVAARGSRRARFAIRDSHDIVIRCSGERKGWEKLDTFDELIANELEHGTTGKASPPTKHTCTIGQRLQSINRRIMKQQEDLRELLAHFRCSQTSRRHHVRGMSSPLRKARMLLESRLTAHRELTGTMAETRKPGSRRQQPNGAKVYEADHRCANGERF
nr:hypothetical protein Iba_chr10bCG0360 [Ipomoea batatas]